MVESKDNLKSVHGPAETEPAPDQTATPLEEVDALATAKSTKSPAFQFYPRDFLSSSKVRKMSLAEIGAYTVLLSTCWLDGSLPNDQAELASELRIKESQFRRMWAGPLGKCFYEKNGRLFNERLERERKIQADYRKKQKENADARWDKLRNATALPVSHASGNAPLPLSSSASSSAKEKDHSAEPHSDSPPLLTFPTTGSGASTWTLTEADVTKWRAAYPSIDVLAECRRALVWIEANQRKTAKGMPAFLVRWFNKAVDRGGVRQAGLQQQQPGSTWAERRALRDQHKAAAAAS